MITVGNLEEARPPDRSMVHIALEAGLFFHLKNYPTAERGVFTIADILTFIIDKTCKGTIIVLDKIVLQPNPGNTRKNYLFQFINYYTGTGREPEFSMNAQRNHLV